MQQVLQQHINRFSSIPSIRCSTAMIAMLTMMMAIIVSMRGKIIMLRGMRVIIVLRGMQRLQVMMAIVAVWLLLEVSLVGGVDGEVVEEVEVQAVQNVHRLLAQVACRQRIGVSGSGAVRAEGN